MSFYRRSDVVYGFSASALGRKFFRLGGLTFYLQAPFMYDKTHIMFVLL